MVLVVMVMNLMHVHNFHYRIVNVVEMLLFLAWTIVHQRMLIIEKKDIIILGEGSTDGLEDTAITTEAEYFVHITKSRKKIYLSLCYNAVNSFLFANDVKVYQFKAKDSEIKPCPLCLGNISKDFIVGN